MATLPSSVLTSATGRKGAAYYSNVSRIILDSASQQSQILASQSALAMQAVGGVVDSMSRGFQKAMEYNLAIKQADFSRELQLREFQLREEDMEMKRVEMRDALLTRSLERKRLEMDTAQKERDFANEPWKRMARAQLSATASEIETVATRMSSSPKDGDAQLLQDLLESISNVKRQALMRGVDPSEASELTKNVLPLVRGLTTIKLSDGDEVSAATLRSASPTSHEWMTVVRDPSVGDHPLFASDSFLKAKRSASREILRDARYSDPDRKTADLLPALLTATGVKEGDASAEVVKRVLTDFRGQSKDWKAEERYQYFRALNPELAAQIVRENPGITRGEVANRMAGVAPERPVLPRPALWEDRDADSFSLQTASMDNSSSGLMDGGDVVRSIELGYSLDAMREKGLFGTTREANLRFGPFRAGKTAARGVQRKMFKDVEDRVAYAIWDAVNHRDVVALDSLLDWVNNDLTPSLTSRFGPGSGMNRVTLMNYQDQLPTWVALTRTFSEPTRTKFANFVNQLPSADAPLVPPPVTPAGSTTHAPDNSPISP